MVGQPLDRRYVVERQIGSGSCGIVYQARSLRAAVRCHGLTSVAIKVLNESAAAQPECAAWFIHEAYLGSKLVHANLVRVVDFGRLPDGRPYTASEFLQGTTLDVLLKRTGRIAARAAIDFISGAAAGLSLLHEYGGVHRDVKPSNLFLALEVGHPVVKVLDLGVAGIYDAKKASKLGAVDVGSSGTWGTPAYLAPEQALGREVDPRADVYGIACVAYRMLTGYEPHEVTTVSDLVRAHLFDDVRPASSLHPGLPKSVDAVFDAALAKDRRDRTRSVADFAKGLKAALFAS